MFEIKENLRKRICRSQKKQENLKKIKSLHARNLRKPNEKHRSEQEKTRKLKEKQRSELEKTRKPKENQQAACSKTKKT